MLASELLNGEYIATASTDSKARLWDLSGTQIAELEGGQWSSVISVSFSPDGERLATALTEGTIRLWNLSGNQIGEFKKYYGKVTRATFSPDGEHLAIKSELRTNSAHFVALDSNYFLKSFQGLKGMWRSHLLILLQGESKERSTNYKRSAEGYGTSREN